MGGGDGLAQVLRALSAPEELFPLAASAAALTHSGSPGSAFVVHATLISLAQRADGLDEAEWARLKAVLGTLAAFVEEPDLARLDAVALAWRAFASPPSLQ